MPAQWLPLLPSAYLGWGLGSNDAANVFGPNVACGAISYRRAAILASIFVLMGAGLEGEKCFHTVGTMASLTASSAFTATLVAALVVNVMTYLRLPVSTSQAIIGSVVGVGLCLGQTPDGRSLTKVVLCWVLTPIGGGLMAVVVNRIVSALMRRWVRNLYVFNTVVRVGATVTACYAAYNLGANNVANVTGTAVGAGVLGSRWGAVLGGICIVVGILTYGRKVTETVGKGIAPLDPFSAWIVILSQAIALHVYTQLGVPVSSSQAVVGAVAGLGLAKRESAVNRRTLCHILAGWISTVIVSATVAYGARWCLTAAGVA